uniref:Uncharacterized protein n=1 Tax=Oryza barthii TaxID=65489 RepID=A0A0D3HSW6_9ORYZ
MGPLGNLSFSIHLLPLFLCSSLPLSVTDSWHTFFSSLRVGDHDVLDAVVSHPAARRVEELRVAAVKSADGPSSDKEVAEMEGEFHLSLDGSTQPSETLRVLDLTGCGGFSLSAGTALPQLTTLRL